VTRTARTRRLLSGMVLLAVVGTACAEADRPLEGDERPRVVLLVVDGLRPDYVTPELMPRLNALAESGVRGLAHHAAFPTVTRVNSPTLFTGRHPGGHGQLGNSVYLPEVVADRVLDTGDRQDLLLIQEAMRGRILTAPSLGEMLDDAGRVFFAASSGSTGSGTLMNPTGAGAGLVHHAMTMPDSLGPVVDEVLGPVPDLEDAASGLPLVARAIDALLRIGVDRGDADVLAAWLTEPDGTAHDTGMGSPETVAVLRGVDAEIGRLLDGLAERGLLEQTNVVVASDHGFSTRVGEERLEDLLVEAGLKASEESLDVVVASDAIHVREGGAERIEAIVELLQATPWVGPVFTRAGEAGPDHGSVPGTASFAAISWDHPRSADILTSADWTDEENAWGYVGSVLTPGVAGHGSSSPWDIRATFLAAGPAFRSGLRLEVPTGNVDLTPTAIHLVGAPVPAHLDGRVLREILVGGPEPSTVAVVEEPVVVERVLDGMRYRLELERVRVGETRYLRGTAVERSPGR